MTHDVFICHSSKDRVLANAICAKLEQNGIRCWIAPRDVLPGSEFGASIVAAIHSSKLAVLVFSSHSNDSPHVHKEIERSVNGGIPILPFRVEDVVPSPSLEYFISDAHWLDALTPPVEKHLDYLVGTVRLLLDRQRDPLEEADETRDTTAAVPSSVPPGPRHRWFLWVGLGALAVLLAVVAGVVLTRGGGTEEAGPGSGATTTGTPAKPFKDEFTKAVDPSWTWVNRDAATTTVTADGWLEIRAQGAPPYHNLLLRKAPSGSYSVSLRLRFPQGVQGFAGLVFTGTDPDSRLQFGWTQTALAATEYLNGNLVTDNEMLMKDLPVSKSREAQLVVVVTKGTYVVRYYNPVEDTYWDMGTGRLDPSLDRIGVMAYSNGGTPATAGFDRIEIF